MSALLRLFSLRHLAANRLRSALGLSAIVLGVALCIASASSIYSAHASVEESVDRMAGRAQWQITHGGPGGVPENLVARVRQIPGVIAAPVIQSSVAALDPPAGSLLVLGVDFQSDAMLRLYRFSGGLDVGEAIRTAFTPDGIILTRRLANRYGLRLGAPVRIATSRGVRTLLVTGLLADEGPAAAVGGFAVMELHATQMLLGQPGYVDRIEVANASRRQLEQACPGYDVRPARRLSSAMQDALNRIQSLAVLGLVALLVGLFIIYNSVQISVVERLKEIGTLRALGATRRQVLGTLVGEWTIVGLAGSALGVLLGLAVARLLGSYTARTLNVLVTIVDMRAVRLPPGAAACGIVLGAGTAALAALLPAWGAAREQPLALLRPYSFRLVTRQGGAFAAGVALAVAGAALIVVIPLSPAAGLAAIALVIVGVALALPRAVAATAWLARRALRRLFGIPGLLAGDNVVRFPQRTALTAITLGGSLAMMVAAAAMVAGFVTATHRWVDEALPFDLTIMPTDLASAIYGTQTLPASVLDEVRRIPGVEIAYGVRATFVDFRGADVMLVALDLDRFLHAHRLRGLSSWARDLGGPATLRDVQAGRALYASRNFLALYGQSPGARLVLPSPSGRRTFIIARGIDDYSWPRGALFTDLRVLRSLWRDDALTYVDVRLAPGALEDAVRVQVARRLTDRSTLFVNDRERIKEASDDVLDQMVAVANVQVAIASVIGFLGIVNSLLISVLQRTREIGLLRAIGMTRRQTAKVVMIEGGFIALVGGLLGIAGGLLGGWLPLRLFTLGITGYLYPIVLPWPYIGGALLAVLVIGALASAAPAYRAATLPVLDAIGYE